MPTVSVNAPKTPVTQGSKGIAAATLPNICKMPGPPAPFVPTPLPNIGKSDNSPQGYSTTVTIEGNAVAIKGATFNSIGDVASQGTGGGLISANVQGPTKFIGPGSMDVKIEGNNVQLLGDPMLNNCGPGGSPANAATMGGVLQAPEGPGTAENLECGEVGSYAELKKKGAKPVSMERDHIPSKASLFARAKKIKNNMSATQVGCVENKLEAGGIAVAIPTTAHRGFSPTCASKNTPAQIKSDASSPTNMKAAVERDTAAMQEHIDKAHPECSQAYGQAAAKMKEHDNEGLIRKAIKDCCS